MNNNDWLFYLLGTLAAALSVASLVSTIISG